MTSEFHSSGNPRLILYNHAAHSLVYRLPLCGPSCSLSRMSKGYSSIGKPFFQLMLWDFYVNENSCKAD